MANTHARACSSHTKRSTGPHWTRPVPTGPVRRELRKLVGSPDVSHRMHPERPVLSSQKHSLTSRNTGHANSVLSASGTNVRCALYACASSWQCTGRSGPASGECFSTPMTSPNFSPAQQKICVTFSQKRRVPPRKLGKRERGTQTPLYPRNSTSFANVPTPPSVHHHVQVC